MNKDTDAENGGREDLIEGRNAILEALRAGRTIDKIYIARGETDKAVGFIASKAREAGAVVVEADRRRLDFMSRTHSHQGVIAVGAVKEYSTIDDILAISAMRGEPPFVIACDEISDPHNLGAIIRTAECAGAHGVVIPKRRSAGASAIVGKTSAGAIEHLAVARVPNLPSALRELQQRGLWIYGAAAGGEALWQTDLKGPLCIVIGSEGGGMGRLITQCCDFLIGIPQKGRISSLNASVAAAVVIYEVLRQRG